MSTTEVKEHPILFGAEMVRAILDGRKTQTRRVCPQPFFDAKGFRFRAGILEAKVSSEEYERLGFATFDSGDYWHAVEGRHSKCPYGKPGDRLWVRENFYIDSFGAGVAQISYAADGERGRACGVSDRKLPNRCGSVPSIHMPRHCSRINLEVTDVRVERVTDISFYDIRAEGVSCPEHDFPGGMCVSECYALRREFAELWDRINKERGFGWLSNPWVWVVEFQVV